MSVVLYECRVIIIITMCYIEIMRNAKLVVTF